MALDSSSSSSTFTPRWNFDVFLSFRGEDTREGFTSFLYDALCRHGINTFMDDQLPKGESIATELIDTIEQSRISIVVFSENYASSGWCLDELVKILECKEMMGHQVRPIFYKVNPSEIRHQNGRTGEYLAKHEEKLGKESKRVMGWRKALYGLASLSGLHFVHGIESRLIQQIVEEVSSKLNRPSLNVATFPVGIDDIIETINPLMGMGLDEVRMIGIYGIGGIGKSTFTKAIFNKYADDFQGSSFLANVKDVTKQHGLVQLQEALLFEILGDANLKLFNADRGISVIRHRLSYKKVLVVIDDVDHLDQLRKLAGDKSWFGRGSRIIVTTRDRHLLEAHGIEHLHEVEKLNYFDSYRLFCWNAFKKPDASEMFENLSSRMIEYANGLPLALIVLGSFLYGRTVKEWESTIARLKSVPNREYNEILKISYDGLDDFDKAIFLDIACFFNGEDKDYVMKIMDACKFFPDIGIRVLIDKCLVTVEYNKLGMHDLLQEMGREIVRKESPNNPGDRSRLWFADDVIDVLTDNLGSNKVEAIKLVVPASEEVYLNAKAFKRMKRLRFLIIRNANVSGDFDYLSNNLRWIEWDGYPLPSLPPNFHPQKLVGLYMINSHVKHLGEGYKVFKNLMHMSMEGSANLIEIPDFSTIPNLETLILRQCRNLEQLHDSVGCLQKLIILNLEYCFNLRRLPSILKLRSLQHLLLTRCRRLETLPHVLENMESLKELRLSKTSIKELPSATQNLSGLETLCVSGCKRLTEFPSGIHKLKRMKHLLIRDCSVLGDFLDKTGDTVEFPVLQKLELRNCNLSHLNFFMNIGCESTLEELSLSRNNFVKIPSWISSLSNLKKLELDFCSRLEELPWLPPTIETISAMDCESLERFPQLLSMIGCYQKLFPSLRNVNFTNCHKLAQHLGTGIANILMNQEPSFSITIPGYEIPEWFVYRTRLGFFYFQVPEHIYDKLVGFALCAVVNDDFTCDVEVEMNGERVMYCVEVFSPMKSDHLWMLYLPCPIVKSFGGWYYIEFTLGKSDAPGSSIEDCTRQCGIFLEFKEDEKLNWVVEDNCISATHSPEVIYDEDSDDESEDAEMILHAGLDDESEIAICNRKTN